MPFDNPIGINDPSGDYTYDAATWRRAQSGLIVHDADPLAPRTGVLNGLSVSVSGMTVQAAPGQAVVGDTVGAMGGYVVVLPAAESETLDARDATFSRVDLVCVVVDDPESSGTERGARLVVVTGTPSVSPSAPAVPEGALALARVTVPPSGALSVIDDRRWTATAGGTVRCTSVSRPAGSSLMTGQTIFETDTGRFVAWTGAAWRELAYGPQPIIQTGYLVVDPPTGGGAGSAPVVFPTPFPSAPILTVSGNSSSPALQNVAFSDLSATGFIMRLNRTNSTSTGCSWIAVWMP